jgi:hypothetical protein
MATSQQPTSEKGDLTSLLIFEYIQHFKHKNVASNQHSVLTLGMTLVINVG